MRPIPLKLLIHSVLLRHPSGVDRWQNTTYTDTNLTRVRIEPSGKVVKTKDNTEVQLTSMMFYDRSNSRPAGIEIQPDDVIVFGTQTYTVKTVERLYDERRLHHLEVGLI